MKKIILYSLTFFILINDTTFSQIELQDIPTESTTQKQTDSSGKFSFSVGLGNAYGVAGGMLLYDFPNHLGIGLSIGGLFLYSKMSLSLRYNFKNDNVPLVLSPALSLFGQSGELSMYRHQDHWQPGAAFSVDLRSYLGKYTYINNTFGLECVLGKSYNGESVKELWFYTGIGIGVTFGGGPRCNGWKREARLGISIMTVALTLVHVALSTFLVFAFAFRGD